jgi:hypothetical protein
MLSKNCIFITIAARISDEDPGHFDMDPDPTFHCDIALDQCTAESS